jgi:translocon-associated protein subunit alpha
MKSVKVVLLVLFFAFPAVIQLLGSGSSFVVSGDDDIMGDVAEGEEDGTVEVEEPGTAEDEGSEPAGSDAAATGTDAEEEEEKVLKPSPDAETNILFIRPTVANDLPAGMPVKLLIGFYNKGSKDFTVDTMDAAFHYPQDYSYYIQNFTTFRYYHTVEPNREATFEYGFTPSETFSSRSFGLTINLNYRDSDGNLFVDAVFNNTVSIADPDECLDGETFFLYIFLAAVVVLLGFGAQQLLTSFGKRRLLPSKPRAQVETGTQNNKTDVDYDWLPKETLDSMNKSPGRQSPKSKTSPRQRAAVAGKRRTGAADD